MLVFRAWLPVAWRNLSRRCCPEPVTAGSRIYDNNKTSHSSEKLWLAASLYFTIHHDCVPGLRRIAPAGAPAGADGRAPDAAAPAGAGSFGAMLLFVTEFRRFDAKKAKVYVPHDTRCARIEWKTG